MATEFAVVRTQAALAGGNQDITSSAITDFSAAIVLVFGDTGAGTAADHGRISRGICNAAGDEFCIGPTAPDALTTASATASQCFTAHSTDRTVIVMQPTNPVTSVAVAAAHVVARATSGVANGVRINWDTTPDAAYEMVVVLFGGLTNNAVFQVTDGGNAIGFQIDLGIVLAFTGSLAAGAGGASADYQPNLGFVTNSGGITQVCISGEWNRAATTDADLIVYSNRVCATVNSGAVTADVSIDSVSSTAFVASSPIGTVPPNMGLFLEFPTPKPSFKCALETLPSGTGTQAFTGLGLAPGLVIGQASLVNATDTITDGATAAVDSPFVFTGTDEFSGCGREQENVTVGAGTPTDTSTLFDTKTIHALTHTGTDAVVATRSSIDATGFTLNFTTATAGRMIVLGIQTPEALSVNNETVTVGDDFLSVLARTTVFPAETVTIADEGLLFEQVATMSGPDSANLQRGRTQQGGLARGEIVQGGAAAGRVV